LRTYRVRSGHGSLRIPPAEKLPAAISSSPIYSLFSLSSLNPQIETPLAAVYGSAHWLLQIRIKSELESKPQVYMGIRAARPSPSSGTVWPAHLRVGPARPLTWPCRVVPAHGLWRRPKHGPVGRFHAGPAWDTRARTRCWASP
jgi:hypothetical protein